MHIILKVFNQILWFFHPPTWKLLYFEIVLFYDAFTERLWHTLAITSTGSIYGFVRISNSNLNFSKVTPNWIQWLVWLKKWKFEVPISIINLVTNRDLKTRQPLKFDIIWLFCLASIIAELRRQSFQSLVKCAVVPFFYTSR
jgi:hypothetical protein